MEDKPPIHAAFRFRQVARQPSPEIVTFLEEMLVLAKEGKLTSMLMGWQVDGGEMESFSAGMFGDAGLHLRYIGLIEIMKLGLLDEFATGDDDE